MKYYDMYVPNELVKENIFLTLPREEKDLPTFAESRARLPQPFWTGHEAAIDTYWKAWEQAFGHLRKATVENGFVANFIDTAFNNDLFMYDSSFIVLFGQYGRRVFDFQITLDNFYTKQHPDGFICRQIRQTDGTDVFHRFDPSSTGPNVMPWAEWEYYQTTGDIDRLTKVFPALVAYHRWLKAYRTWPDGMYWANGWSGAADNVQRIPGNMIKEKDYFYHGHLIWCDNTMIQVFAAKLLIAMANVLGRNEEVSDLREEVEYLSTYINKQLWGDRTDFYHDQLPNGELTGVKNIGAYWALLAGLVPKDRLDRFIRHLTDPSAFNRPHRIPSLSAEHPSYQPDGDNWLGAVWAPTNYMVLRGLSQAGYEPLAYEIAQNHLEQVVEVFQQTGTIWENYAPEKTAPGIPAKPDFVGWGGLSPISCLFEYIFGLRVDLTHSRVVWNVRVLEEHGIAQYPFGQHGLLDLHCAARYAKEEKPVIKVKSDISFELIVKWDGGEEIMEVHADE